VAPLPCGPARPGDLVVAEMNSGYWPGEVTGVTGSGGVRLWRRASALPGQADGNKGAQPDPAARVYLVPARLIEVRGVLATAAVHTLPGSPAAGMPYLAPGDLYSALRPHLHSSPVADYLRRRHCSARRRSLWPFTSLGGLPAIPVHTRNPGRTQYARRSRRRTCSHRTPLLGGRLGLDANVQQRQLPVTMAAAGN
jgi:hypothetical protein